jgi:DNA polymerase-3 subunit epsilon
MRELEELIKISFNWLNFPSYVRMDKNINKELPNSGKHTFLNSIKSNRYVDFYWNYRYESGERCDLCLSVRLPYEVYIFGDSFEVILLQYKYLHDNRLSNEVYYRKQDE